MTQPTPSAAPVEASTHAAEAALSHHARLAVEHIPAMLAYWDRHQTCCFANAAYRTWFGVSPQALIGKGLLDLLGPRLYELNQPHIQAALRGEAQIFERIIPGPDGVQRHSLAHYLPHQVNGEVLGFVAHVTEITQLRETEAALRHEQELRRRIEQHAVDLRALLDERSEMLQVLAHEVRQPLNNASAALQDAAEHLQGSGATAATSSLARARQVLGEVQHQLDNTLAEASLLAGAEPITRQDIDIDTLFDLCAADLSLADRPRVRLDRQSASRTVTADLRLLRLALRNLLVNALRHSPPERTVVLRALDSDEPLGLLFEVEDQGAGIDPALRGRLFERGVRGAGPAAGHGLGLYITQRVMALHGGRAEVARSGPGGTCMRLLLPADAL